ncbi:16S rRNA (uracil(1498)-N(3))-methyltransferase [Elizabethkingia sp. JS20170427COW]|uniref:RsmE family RNA methyltransferase n=1 Tax=Elizabethkingia sp. JS20170427COW TaxID=2583851 RepID=UPI0011102DF9|nr:RsmE family RNA methyltransferase [Elizabethkingia sp. JS20170427COW]QCX52387.1 16S rRNA (uracil(1498)-N(3))-methyltransferase [Elizabethkingia sp. JS20170427COW]
MKLFFGELKNSSFEIHEDDQTHIRKVLRMKEGEEIYVTDGKGALAKGILFFEGKKVCIDIQDLQQSTPKFPHYLHIAIAPTKNIDRIEFFVEKATEMGVSEISFLQTEKTERKNINIDKIRKQVIAASKQSLRSHFPKVNEMIKISEFIKNTTPENTFVAHCHSELERQDISHLGINNNICFLIGPEGDFSPQEIQLLKDNHIKAASLGPQRLRTETAGVFVAAWSYQKMF